MPESKIRCVQEFIEFIDQYGHESALVLYNSDQSKQVVTYTELVQNIKSLAAILSKNIRKGDRVMLYWLDPLDWIVGYFATMLMGGIAVTADNRASNQFIEDVQALTTPLYLFTSHPEKVAFISQKTKIVDLTKCNYQPCGDLSYPPADSEAPAEIVFTSGTWSRPKGVTLSQQNIFSNLNEIIIRFPLQRNDVLLSIIPLAHMYEQMAGLLTPLYNGSTICYHSLDTKKEFQQALKAIKPTKLVVVPLVFELLHSSYRKNFSILFEPLRRLVLLSRLFPRAVRRVIWFPLRLPLGSRLNEIIVGGAAMPLEIDRFFQGLGIKVGVGYGLSETSPVIASSDNQRRRAGEVGQLYPIFEIKQNQRGELLVRGLSVFMGYWPNLNNTAETWFNTGDIVVMDQKGSLVIKGRSKNMFVYPSGDKIFAEDIEYLVNRFWNCQSCCINLGVGLSNELQLVVTNPSPDKEKLLTYISEQLPSFVEIQNVIYYGDSSLPQTFSKKINRQAVSEWTRTMYGHTQGM